MTAVRVSGDCGGVGDFASRVAFDIDHGVSARVTDALIHSCTEPPCHECRVEILTMGP